MEKKEPDRLISGLYLVAAITLLLGAFFRLQHYPHGNHLFFGGLFLGTIASMNQFIGLIKAVKKGEKGEPQKSEQD